MGLPAAIYCILGLIILFQTDSTIAQNNRRPSPRSLNTNIRSSSTTSEFDCPEEFGYYPHPTDCTQYYVCVFGGALLESCTGGLMYSHELQTCDWPRNVGCELPDSVEQLAPGRDVTPRVPQVQQIQPHKFRFSSIKSSSPETPSRSSSIGYAVAAQIQALPPPPELKIPPKPIITSRGQPKHSIQEDIAKLYAETHDTLPPVEEEESDRQQRVYRGQPSTVGQVQRDRDGILQQSSVNAIPNHGKIGSFAFGSQSNQHSDENSLQSKSDKKLLDRIKRNADLKSTGKTNVTFEKRQNEDYIRAPRQLRPPLLEISPWQSEIDKRSNQKSKSYQGSTQTSGIFNPFLTPPGSGSTHLFKTSGPFGSSRTSKLQFNPYANSYTKTNSVTELMNKPYNSFLSGEGHTDESNFHHSPKDSLIHATQFPLYLNTHHKYKKNSDDNLPDNFSYFHIGNNPPNARDHTQISPVQFVSQSPILDFVPSSTPKHHFLSFNTVGGFYNNQPSTNLPPFANHKPYSKFRTIASPIGIQTPSPNLNNEDTFFIVNNRPITNQTQNSLERPITTLPPPPLLPTTTLRIAPDIGSNSYYPENVAFKQLYNNGFPKSAGTYTYQLTKDSKTDIPQIYHGSRSTQAPVKSTPTHFLTGEKPTGPIVGIDFDFNKFVANIRELAQSGREYTSSIQKIRNPKFYVNTTTEKPDEHILTTSSYPWTRDENVVNKSTPRPFFGYNTQNKLITTAQPTTSTITIKSTTSDQNEYYYEDDEDDDFDEIDLTKPSAIQTTTKSTRGYDSFIKSIPSPAPSKGPIIDYHNETDGDEYDDDEYYYDDEDEEDDYVLKPPPVNKSKFVPKSETMAPRPTKPSFPSLSDSIATKSQSISTTSVPPIIQFPKDIFQDLAPFHNLPRYLNNATLRPYTLRTRIMKMNTQSQPETTTKPFLNTTTETTISTTTRKVWTIRPNRGQSRWKALKASKALRNTEIKQQFIEDDDKKISRVETSPQAPSPPVFVQQQQQQQSTKPIQQSTRNYYNTTNNNPPPYDAYYSVYDDEVDLYRDIDYSQQYNSNPDKVRQSTYRPSTITTSTPTPAPVLRETLVKQTPVYEKPSIAYNSEYDDALISQLDVGSSYNPPSRTQLRGDRNELNAISDQPYTSRKPSDYSISSYTPTRSTYSLSTTPTKTTTLPTTTTTPPAPRSTLLDGGTNKTTKTINLSTRAGILSQTSLSSPIPDSPAETNNISMNPSYDNTTNNQTKNITRLLPYTDQTSVVTETKVVSVTTSYNLYSNTNKIYTTSPTLMSSLPADQQSSPVTDDQKRKTILNFVVSDLQPQSFKPRSTPRPISTSTSATILTENFPQFDTDYKIVNRQPSIFSSALTSTTSRPFSTSTTLVKVPSTPTTDFKIVNIQPSFFSSPSTFRVPTYQSNIEGKVFHDDNNNPDELTYDSQSNKDHNLSHETIEIVPLYDRPDYRNRIPTPDTIKPTTYAPPRQRGTQTIKTPLPFSILAPKSIIVKTTDSQEANSDAKLTGEPTIDTFDIKTTTPATKIVSKFSYKFSDDYQKELQYLSNNPTKPILQRTNLFKEVFNKTYETSTPSKTLVSPYTSLRSILQKEPVKSTSLRPVIRPSPLVSRNLTDYRFSSSPNLLRSYFLITQSPLNISTTTSVPPNLRGSTQSILYLTTLRNRPPVLPPSSTTFKSSKPSESPLIVSTSLTTEKTTSTSTTTAIAQPTTTSTTLAPLKSTQFRTIAIDPADDWRPIVSTDFNRAVKLRNRISNFRTSTENSIDNDEPTTYSPRGRFSSHVLDVTTAIPDSSQRKKNTRIRPTYEKTPLPVKNEEIDTDEILELIKNAQFTKLLGSVLDNQPKISRNRYQNRQSTTSTDNYANSESSDTTPRLVEITERPSQYFTHYRHLSTEKPLGSVIPSSSSTTQNSTILTIDSSQYSQLREKFRATVEMPEFNVPTESEQKIFSEPEEKGEEGIEHVHVQPNYTKLNLSNIVQSTTIQQQTVPTTPRTTSTTSTTTTTALHSTQIPIIVPSTEEPTVTISIVTELNSTTAIPSTTPTTPKSSSTTYSISMTPPRASRVNTAIKTTIAATIPRRNNFAASLKCTDNTPNTKCNEIPSRNNNRNRGGSHYTSNNEDRPSTVAANRGTHPPRSRPTLKPSGTIVSKATEFVDIYRFPPTRPEPLYPQPIPDKTAARCRKDVCLLPDCSCGARDIPGDLPVEDLPQIVLLTFDDSVNDLNKQLYTDLFEKGRVNPNGCPITATFYVSHEWTDYSQVQNLYADGHEMASHTISHSFGEQFSQKKWTREVAGQREILAAYGGVKLSDVRGMRAPFLSVGGNKMFKMLYDSNFTYDSSMPVYENRPPSWPYTLDYKIFHDCMIPPCPTKSYPGVWQVPMVMWQDLNGGRCSMGDACANPPDSEGVVKMIMKNFERHYTTNRAPFGLFYHAAWFTQPHHKEGFIKFLDMINAMNDVWIITNWQALQWVRDPTPLARINSFQPFQCDYSDRPKRCNNPKVCNLWHKSGVRYMRTCQPCPEIYPWTGKTGIRSSRVDIDNDE